MLSYNYIQDLGQKVDINLSSAHNKWDAMGLRLNLETYFQWRLTINTDTRWRNRHIQVCQIRVMTEFKTITLTQDGAVDLKTIAVFLFPKFNRQPFFSRSKSNAMSALLFAKKQIYQPKKLFYYFIEVDMINPGTFLWSFKKDSSIIM